MHRESETDAKREADSAPPAVTAPSEKGTVTRRQSYAGSSTPKNNQLVGDFFGEIYLKMPISYKRTCINCRER